MFIVSDFWRVGAAIDQWQDRVRPTHRIFRHGGAAGNQGPRVSWLPAGFRSDPTELVRSCSARQHGLLISVSLVHQLSVSHLRLIPSTPPNPTSSGLSPGLQWIDRLLPILPKVGWGFHSGLSLVKSESSSDAADTYRGNPRSENAGSQWEFQQAWSLAQLATLREHFLSLI